MADQTQNTAVFKMVLCGDGGTVSLLGSCSRTQQLTCRVSKQLNPAPPPQNCHLTCRKGEPRLSCTPDIGLTSQTTFVKRHLTGEFEKKYIGASSLDTPTFLM